VFIFAVLFGLCVYLMATHSDESSTEESTKGTITAGNATASAGNSTATSKLADAI
jgi:hypothetical protein